VPLAARFYNLGGTDFEATVERSLLELRDRFNLQAEWYDPYQMTAVAQHLTAQRVPMVEFPQTLPNLTEASQNLYDLVKGCNLQLYPDADMRLAVSRTVALEDAHGRGWRIAKEKASHKIDVIVALAQAALGAAKYGPTTRERDPLAEEAKRHSVEHLNATFWQR
jgi:phage terminase large subunit-like protein